MLKGMLCKESVNLRGGNGSSGILIEASISDVGLVDRNTNFD